MYSNGRAIICFNSQFYFQYHQYISRHLANANLQPANGWRYPLVGEMRQRRFDGTDFKLRKVLENAQSPTSRVHAVLGNLVPTRTLIEKKAAILTPNSYTQLQLRQRTKDTTCQK